MQIELLNAADIPEWNDFIKKDEEIPFFFTLEWEQIIEDVFHLKPFYYLIREEDELIAIAPFFLVRSPIFGNRLISLPFTDYGGVYFKKKIDLRKRSIILNSFFKHIETLINNYKIGYVELRGQVLRNFAKKDTNCLVRSPYVTFCLDLRRPFEAIYKNFSRSIKYNLKRFRNDIKIVRCKEREQLEKVYDIYLRQLRKFGSPPLPKVYFEREWDILKEKNMFEIFLAYYNKQIIAAEGLLIFRKKIYAELIMSDPKFDKLCPKVYLFYETIKRAYNSKFHFYDFGRARKYSGVYEHKRRWGGEERNIDYSFIIYNQKADVVLDASQKKFVLPRKIFRKLPLFCLRNVGPIIRKNIGK